MKNNIPYFEVDGTRYEIKRNRYLQAEFDKFKSENQMSDEEQIAYAKESDFQERVEKLAKRKDELYAKYLETFDDKDEELYNKACNAYNTLLEKEGKGESLIGKQRKTLLAVGEKIIVKSLQINHKGETIRTEKEALDIWNAFCEDIGELGKTQFVVFTLNYIMGADEEIENPFIAQAKAKAEQRANMKKGLKIVK